MCVPPFLSGVSTHCCHQRPSPDMSSTALSKTNTQTHWQNTTYMGSQTKTGLSNKDDVAMFFLFCANGVGGRWSSCRAEAASAGRREERRQRDAILPQLAPSTQPACI